MDFFRPTTLDEALEIRAAHPGALPIHGGTDVMVELNFDKHRPPALLDVSAVEEITGWSCGPDDDAAPSVTIGAGMTWTAIIDQLAERSPGLAIAARTVGSPQIRNRGTLGGSLGSASPAGDGLPLLVASGSSIEVASAARGRRFIAADEWLVRPRRTVLEDDELIVGIRTPDRSRAQGSQQFAKIGTRNAMVIAVASFAIDIDLRARRVGSGIGSAGPTVLRAPEAEAFAAAQIAAVGGWEEPVALPDGVAEQFGELVGNAATPIDDVRGTAAYRTHAVGVMARRTFAWAWTDRLRTAHAQGAPA